MKEEQKKKYIPVAHIPPGVTVTHELLNTIQKIWESRGREPLTEEEVLALLKSPSKEFH